MKKNKLNNLNRYIILKNDEKFIEVPTISSIPSIIGCTLQHIYKYLNVNKFKYKKNVYTIIDKLDSFQ